MKREDIDKRAREYAEQYDDRYQVAMFKAYIEGAEWMKEKLTEESNQYRMMKEYRMMKVKQ